MNKKLMMLYEIIFVIILICVFMFTAHAEVYKWKQGKVTQYSDIPPQTNAPYAELKSNKTISPELPESPPVEVPKSIPLVKNELPINDKSAVKKTTAQQEVDRKGREKSCATAKDNLQKLKNGGSIYKENTKGERTYLDETAIKNEMAAAEKEMQASCQ